MTKRNINACARCGSKPSVRFRNELSRPFGLECDQCKERSPLAGSMLEAVNLWNHANPPRDLFGDDDAV